MADNTTFVPGVLRCAKCDFRLVKTTLNVADGNAYADESPDDCPNCDVPMWRVTWKDEATEAYKVAESQMERALAAERALAVSQDAMRSVIDNRSSAYRARNGREVGIQGDDGEKCWIVHSDHIFELERALDPDTPAPLTVPAFIEHVATVSEAVGWQAGVGGMETAGAILSFLAKHPHKLPVFMTEGFLALGDAVDILTSGRLTWHATNGKIVSPEQYADHRRQGNNDGGQG